MIHSMQRNPDKIKKFLPDLLLDQPNSLRELLLSRGFHDLCELIEKSPSIYDLIKKAKTSSDDNEGDRLEVAKEDTEGATSFYLKIDDVPEGVNPLDSLSVSGIPPKTQKEKTTYFSFELGCILAIPPFLRTYEKVQKGEEAYILKRDGRDAVKYLLDMPDKRVA